MYKQALSRWALLILDSNAKLLRSQTALTEEVKNGMPTLNLDETGLKKKNHLSDMIKINCNKNILFQKPNNQNGLQFTLIAPDHRSNKETLTVL